MESAPSVRAGEVIAGKFQIERILGEGGMGYVVAARHLQLGQMVALKFIREDVCSNEFKSRFMREARNTVKLKSKHVSRVLDVGALEGGSPYMVMEYLEGTDLSELLQKRGPFPPQEAADYIIQACEAIAEAHGHGIVHRDLKPANLFLTRGTGGEAVVKVLDFGVSKVLDMEDEGREHDSAITKATDLLGSPSYMAPEQVVSAKDADARSDVWSLGVILFRLVSGKAPFAGNSLGDLIQKIVHGPLPNLREVRPDIPEGLEHVVWRCFEREREKRPDAIELARMLSPYAGPNATPSLERIAILGPALVRAPSHSIPPPHSIPPQAPQSNKSFTGPKNWPSSSQSIPPGMMTTQPMPNMLSGPPPPLHAVPSSPKPKKDMSATSFIVWALFFLVIVGSLAFIGRRLMKMPALGGAPSAATFSTVPPAPSTGIAATVDTTPATVEPAPTPAPIPTIIPSYAPSAKTAPSAHPSATSTHGSGKAHPGGGGTTAPTAHPTATAPATAAPTATTDIPNTREN